MSQNTSTTPATAESAHNLSQRPDIPATAPDPDEDDLDDLDGKPRSVLDMLGEFSATTISPPSASTTTGTAASHSTTTPSSSGPGRPKPAVPTDPDVPTQAEDDFAHELQAGMASMLKELEQNPDMAKQFEQMMAQLGGAGILPGTETGGAHTGDVIKPARPPPPMTNKAGEAKAAPTSTKTSAPASTAPSQADSDFQSTIRKTMDRMKASSDSATTAATPDSDSDPEEMIANLLKEMQAANGGPDGEGDDAFGKMLLGMMEQLTNKEILYEPMKELDQKFPGWLEEKRGGLKVEDRERYEVQRGLVREIVGRFEREGYSDGNAEDREFIVEKMQKMQEAGAPPPDLIGDADAASSLAGMDAGCPQQ